MKLDKLDKLIKGLKYKFAFDIASELSDLLLSFFEKQEISNANPVIIPVPLHKKRLRERGFNQAELLARSFHANYQVETKILQRNKYTSAQAKLKEKARKENIKQAFACHDSEKVKNKIVVLVDDVITTGSTLNECARVLKKSGAKEVWGLAIAKG